MATPHRRFGRIAALTAAAAVLGLGGCSRGETRESLAPVQLPAPPPPSAVTSPSTSSTETAVPTYDVDQSPPHPTTGPPASDATDVVPLRGELVGPVDGTATTTSAAGAPTPPGVSTTASVTTTASTTNRPTTTTTTTGPPSTRGTTSTTTTPVTPAALIAGTSTTITASPPPSTTAATAPATTGAPNPTTAAPTTTGVPPTSGPANAEPIHHDAAIAVANATVVGAGVGPADIDAVIAAISAEHGDPSADTKWMTASGACQDDADTRVIWWSDLRIVAERGAGTTAIVGWSFGDPQAAPNVASGPGASPPSLGLATDGGVTLGDARDDVRRTLDDGTVTSEDAARIVVTAGPRTLVFLFSADGHLSGIGSEDTTCG